jgi:hypothetical protein
MGPKIIEQTTRKRSELKNKEKDKCKPHVNGVIELKNKEKDKCAVVQ